MLFGLSVEYEGLNTEVAAFAWKPSRSYHPAFTSQTGQKPQSEDGRVGPLTKGSHAAWEHCIFIWTSTML